MHFLNPQVLWLLLILPPLGVAAVWYAWRRRKRFLEHYGDWNLVSRFSSPLGKTLFLGKALAAALGVAALVVAIARPSFVNSRVEYPQGTLDVVAVVDVSRSMATQDYEGKIPGPEYKAGTRLDAGRYILLNDVIPALGYNRLGMVTFAGAAFPQAFVSDDVPAITWVIKHNMTIGNAPGEGSQLADALNMAALLFDLDSPPGHKRMILLLSDGGNDSDPDKLAAAFAELKKRNVEVVIAGLGSRQARPIPVAQLSPNDRYRFADQQWYTMDGEVVTSSLDETTLISIKNAVGGRYTRVDQISDFDMGRLSSGTDVRYIKGEREVFAYPLMLGLLLLALAVAAPREPFRHPITLKWRKLLPRKYR
jgi:Ca-activated chloride channel family protein